MPPMHRTRNTVLFLGALQLALAVSAQERPDPAALMAAQRAAMASFASIDGTWRGTATMARPNGDKHTIVQTERVGPMLDGTVKVIEGRGYEANGAASFNALAILSYDVATSTYRMRSHAMGMTGDFVVQRTADGFAWEIPAGPTTIRYNAIVKDGLWIETGDRVAPGRDPVRFIEMRLERIGDSTWPAAGAIPPK